MTSYENRDSFGLLHRNPQLGPAKINADGSLEYWFHGLKHRDDGPAVVHADGSEEYWFNGEQYPSKRKWKEDVREAKYSGSAYHQQLTTFE